MTKEWTVHNTGGSRRVIVTKELPGQRWLDLLKDVDCTVEVCQTTEALTVDEIIERFGSSCDGAIGLITEDWNAATFLALAAAGATVYSNYAVGYNNVDVAGTSAAGIAVGNTPGVLTETTAAMAVTLTFSAGRRVVEADKFMRSGGLRGWLPTMYIGQRFFGATVGIIGCGRIGAAYGRMMVEGFKMNLVYYDLHPNEGLEKYIANYSELLTAHGEKPRDVSQARHYRGRAP